MFLCLQFLGRFWEGLVLTLYIFGKIHQWIWPKAFHCKEVFGFWFDLLTSNRSIQIFYFFLIWPGWRGATLITSFNYGNCNHDYHFLSTINSLSEVKLFSRVWLFATPWTVAYHAPPSMGFSRQEYWSGLPFPSPEDLPDPGIEPRYPAL